MRVVNLYGGPGTGKSTTMAALFAELKYQGYNTEQIQEYAKDAAWERRGKKVFQAQEYIFGKQSFRTNRVIDEVEFVVTDSPILQGLAYMDEDFYLPSLPMVIKEAYNRYDNIDIFLKRSSEKPYNPKGRNQDEHQAICLDSDIQRILADLNITPHIMTFGRQNVPDIIEIMNQRGWLASPAETLLVLR